MDPVHDPLVLEHVANGEGEQFGDAQTGLDAEEEQGTIPECIPAAEAVAHLMDFGIGERASAFHQSSNVEGQVLFAPPSSLVRLRRVRPMGADRYSLLCTCSERRERKKRIMLRRTL
jgi:hypothetical protein